MKPDVSSSTRNAADWLDGSSGLRTLLGQAQHLDVLTRTLRQWLNQPWSAAIRAAQLDGPALVVYCDDAATLTLFRYRIPEAVRHLQRTGWPALQRLEAKVRPSGHPSKAGV